MAKSTSAKHSEHRDTLQLRLREGLLIALVAVCVYIFVSLVSYDPADPGWSRTGAGEGIHNAGGPVGAWLADVFYALFGYMAYLFPAMLAFRAAKLFQHRLHPGGFDSVVFALRSIGFVLVMIASTNS